MRKVTQLLSKQSPETIVFSRFEAQRDGALSDKELALFEKSLAQSNRAQRWVKEQQELIYQLQLDALPSFTLAPAARQQIQLQLYRRLRRGASASRRRLVFLALILMVVFGFGLAIGSDARQPIIYRFPNDPVVIQFDPPEAPFLLGEESSFNGVNLSRFALAGGLRAVDAGQFMIDRQNNIWLNSRNGRLLRFDQQAWRSFAFEDELWRDGLGPINASNDQALWLGNPGFGVLRFDGQDWVAAPFAGQFAEQHLISATAAADGTLWLGTSGGLLRYDGFSWQLFNVHNGLSFGSINQLLANPNGTVWFTTSQTAGLALFDGSDTVLYGLPEQVYAYEVTALAAAPDGAIWLGTQNGLLRFDGDDWTTLPILDGSVDNSVTSLAFADSGVLWAGTREGLYRYDGQDWLNVSDSELSWATVFDIRTGPDGITWALTDSGLLRLSNELVEPMPPEESEEIAP